MYFLMLDCINIIFADQTCIGFDFKHKNLLNHPSGYICKETVLVGNQLLSVCIENHEKVKSH